MLIKKFNILFFLAVFLILSCKKHDPEDTNPYDDPSLRPPDNNEDTINLEPGSFAYLHHYIFKPTCANSGCHDGNFEPDFRTISSAYNTLVYHQVVQNDDAGTYSYRVVPGNVEKSFLFTRLTTSVPANASGMMPLTVEPGSEWRDKKDEYIELIRAWIANGAMDPFGNDASQGNPQPQVIGLLAFEKNDVTTPLERVEGQGITPIGIPNDRSIDLWLAVSDDKTTVENLKVLELKMARSLTDFSGAKLTKLELAPAISYEGFDGEMVSYRFKANVDFLGDTLGSFIFLRSYFQDEDHPGPAEIPNSGSNEVMKTRFTLQVDSI